MSIEDRGSQGIVEADITSLAVESLPLEELTRAEALQHGRDVQRLQPPGDSISLSQASVTIDSSAHIDFVALFSLAAQHFSVTWSQRTVEFASYLFLIDLFPSTLLPSALYGFFSTFSGVIFGGTVGSLIDTSSSSPSRLKVVRIIILVAKLAVSSLYALFLVLFTRYSEKSAAAGQLLSQGGHGDAPIWVLFTFIVLASCISKLSDIAMSVAIERDWVTTIASGSDARLTRLNLWLRRINLGCKLLAPLFVGLLTSTIRNVPTIAVIGGIAIAGLGFELWWINIVWKRFPVLAMEDSRRNLQPDSNIIPRSRNQHKLSLRSIKSWALTSYDDWRSFIHCSVFPSSLSISLLYFTTLSFDGTMIAWLKTNMYSDPLISGMRGVGVITGLMGTLAMPVLERKIGLARAGSWSIWFEVLSLLPVLLSFYIPSPTQGHKSPHWNQALLFGGMAISRIGLWSFDLCQLKILQQTLADHPRRNTLSGLQYSLQNILDLAKYVMVIILSRPSQFKYTAALSFGAVVSGACFYMIYLRRERGHVVHTDWLLDVAKKLH